MKITAISFSLFLLGLFFIGCEKDDLHIIPSAQVTSQYHSVNNFNELRIEDPFQVYVQFSDTDQELRIEANENLHAYIEVRQNNGYLSIKLKEDVSQFVGTPVLKVFLTTKALQTIKAAGATKVYLQNTWQANQTEIELTGACQLEGTITSEKLTANITGASTLDIQGKATAFDIEATGASNMTGFDFECAQLTTELTGACNLSLTVNDEMRVTATGASKVRYRGDAVVKYQNLTGGSEIIKE